MNLIVWCATGDLAIGDGVHTVQMATNVPPTVVSSALYNSTTTLTEAWRVLQWGPATFSTQAYAICLRAS